MLQPRDIIRKQAQDLGFTSGTQGSLYDLIQAIRVDRGLTPDERSQLLQQIQSLTQGASGSTPLSALMYQGLGGILGGVIAKYFGMGRVTQLASAVAGFGLGSSLFNKLNQPPSPYRGYRLLG